MNRRRVTSCLMKWTTAISHEKERTCVTKGEATECLELHDLLSSHHRAYKEGIHGPASDVP